MYITADRGIKINKFYLFVKINKIIYIFPIKTVETGSYAD